MSHPPCLHWVGAGLASGPGIVTLANERGQITVWDMIPDRAEALKAQLAPGACLNIRHLNLDENTSRTEFRAALNPGDIIISMLPTALHTNMARLALAENCQMVTSSYLSPEMLLLDHEATEKNLSLVNEVGLDPGIDHLFAHLLVAAARKAGVLGQGRTIDFISCCGGFPAQKTPFTYKFSWTPIGVLTALTNPARIIRNGRKQTIAKAWQQITELSLDGEIFETYPNRDSLPYIAEYGLEDEKDLRSFVRSTLRLSGWKAAWKDIFSILDSTPDKANLKALSDRLWQDHHYGKGEQDRVVLHVALTATAANGHIWRAALTLDTTGSDWQSAMATTVSLTIAQAVNALLDKRLSPGVITPPHDISEVCRWLKGLHRGGLTIMAENIDLQLKS